MSIFSQNDFEVVQDVIRSNGLQNGNGKKAEPDDETSVLNRQSERIQELIEEIDALPDEKARKLMCNYFQGEIYCRSACCTLAITPVLVCN